MPAIPILTRPTHSSCVSYGASAVLILGKSGAGKSALALQLMALGGVLVADDQTILTSGEAGVIATCPVSTIGQIEARGVGILKADSQDSAFVRLVVDLDKKEENRLPNYREIDLLDHRIPLLHLAKGTHFPAAIIQILKGGILS
jgi:HPr kinase/phosphorylase